MKRRDYVVFLMMGLYLVFLPLFIEKTISIAQSREVNRDLKTIAMPVFKNGYPICMEGYPNTLNQEKENRKWVSLNVNCI